MWQDSKHSGSVLEELVLKAPRREVAEMYLHADREEEAILPFDIAGLKDFAKREVFQVDETCDNLSVSGKDLLAAIKNLSSSDNGFSLIDLEVVLPETYSLASRKLVEALERLIEVGVLGRDCSLLHGAARYTLVSNDEIDKVIAPAAPALTPAALGFASKSLQSVVDEYDQDIGLNVKPSITVIDYLRLRENGDRIPKLLDEGSLLKDIQPIYGAHIQIFERLEEEAVKLGLISISKGIPPRIILNSELS